VSLGFEVAADQIADVDFVLDHQYRRHAGFLTRPRLELRVP
jgi:hypothetical protein